MCTYKHPLTRQYKVFNCKKCDFVQIQTTYNIVTFHIAKLSLKFSIVHLFTLHIQYFEGSCLLLLQVH
jgi:hypothetical protein